MRKTKDLFKILIPLCRLRYDDILDYGQPLKFCEYARRQLLYN